MYKYDRIICVFNGTLGTNTKIQVGGESYEGTEHYVIYNDSTTAVKTLDNRALEYLCSVDRDLWPLHNPLTTAYMNNEGNDLWIRLKGSLTNTDFIVTVYGLKKSTDILDVLGME